MKVSPGLSVAANYLALPAVAVPTGIGGDGLPSGVQAIAAPGADHVALAAAADIERACGALAPVTPR